MKMINKKMSNLNKTNNNKIIYKTKMMDRKMM